MKTNPALYNFINVVLLLVKLLAGWFFSNGMVL